MNCSCASQDLTLLRFLLMTLATLSTVNLQSLYAGQIEDKLEAAKVKYDDAVSDARVVLTTALEAEVKRAAGTGKLESTLTARKELQEFQESDKLPRSTQTKSALADFRAAEVRARNQLIDAHKTAIAEYTKGLDLEQAQATKLQMQQLESGKGLARTVFNWSAAKRHVKYEHIAPNFSRASYAPYIDEPATRLLDREMKASGIVGWQNVKPNLIQFTFDKPVAPKFIRMHFFGSEGDREVGAPKSVAIYDSADPKTQHKLGEIMNDKKTTAWLEVPLSRPSRTFVVDIERTGVWTLLAEVEFK